MKHVLYLCIALLALAGSSYAQEARAGSVGTDFWIAIPPNETVSFPVGTLAIYISSAFDTEISFTGPNATIPRKRQIKAGTTLVLEDKNGFLVWGWEVRNAEVVENMGLHITSVKPVTVSVLNSKLTTSDGYTAIPTVSWDKEYIAASYYDFKEYSPWAGGFLIIAKDDGTNVTITLRGVGADKARTSGGRAINNTPYTITMNAGDTYMVRGDATTQGQFDITGSHIVSTRPIGLIGFHERTTIPNSVTSVDGVQYSGRNHLVEMLPPVSSWGTIHVTTGTTRSGSNDIGQGDFYRVVAAEANTQVTCRYYDPVTKALSGSTTSTIANAGGFIDVEQAIRPKVLPHGQVVWTSTKPVLVMLYACSYPWDGFTLLDPFSVTIIPPTRHAQLAMFQTPATTSFFDHYLNIVVGPFGTESVTTDDLKSITLNGNPLYQHPGIILPGLLDGKVPGTPYHTARIKLTQEPSSYRLAGNGRVTLGGYVYGHGNADAYGWPIGGRPYSLIGIDTMPPVLVRKPGCASWDFKATELRDIPTPRSNQPKETDQVESGISSIIWDGRDATNLVLLDVGSGQFPLDSALKERIFTVRVADPTQAAMGILVVRDFAGNEVRDTLVWEGLPLTERVTPFGITRPGTVSTSTVTLRNGGAQPLALTSASFRNGSPFALQAPVLPVTLPPNDSIMCTITFAPKEQDGPGVSIDTMIVTAGCYRAHYILTATAGRPEIKVDDVRLVRTATVANEVCVKDGGRIVNTGTDTLIVHSIDGISGGFSYKAGRQFSLPVRILPGADVFIGDICYQGTDFDIHSIDVTIRSNAVLGDSQAVWSVVGDTALSVHDAAGSASRLALHPTPSTGRVSVTIPAAFPMTEPIEIIDGKGMRAGTFTLPAGTMTIELDLSAFASGSYTVHVGRTSTVYSGRLVIVR